MAKYEIVEALAKEKAVETMVENIAHKSLDSDLRDLCQEIYCILLDYDDAKIQDLWSNSQMRFFLARIVCNQYRSRTSSFHYLIRKYQEQSEDLTGKDYAEEQ